jgi:integrase
LQRWWVRWGEPRRGPVFLVMKGSRAGQRQGKRSHARELRYWLWQAGVRRGETEESCPLQSDTEQTRCVDFHSFRRAFNTALAAAGVNVQQAMALAGHADPRTHMRYVHLAQRGALAIPAAALPGVRALPGPNEVLTEGRMVDETACFPRRPHRGLDPADHRAGRAARCAAA